MNKVLRCTLPAYTITEIVVVMLLSSIVVTMAYKSFAIVNHQYHLFRKSQDVTAQQVLLDRLLATDFFRAVYITRPAEDQIQCVFKDHRSVYHFTGAYITRRMAGVLDTFYVQPTRLEIQAIPQSEAFDEPFVQSLSFAHGPGEAEPNTFRYEKHYGADLYINLTAEANAN